MRSNEHAVDPAEVELKLFGGDGFDDDGSAMFGDEESSAVAYKLVAGRPSRSKASKELSSAMALDAVKRAAVGVGARALFYPALAYKMVAGRPARSKASEESSSSSPRTSPNTSSRSEMRSNEHAVDPAEVELKLFGGDGFDDDGSAMFGDEESSAVAYKLVAGRPSRSKASKELSSAMALDAVKRAAVGVGARALFYPALAYKMVAGRPARSKASEESSSSSSSSVTTLDAAKHAAVGVGARALFYPTLAYSMARNRVSSDFHWWDPIDGTKVLLGAVPFPGDVPLLHAKGVRAVVTITEPYERLVDAALYKDHDMVNLVLPTRDYLYAPSQDDLRRATAFIHGVAEKGESTYVHCKAGRARSATVVMCYLVRYKGMTAVKAYDKVRACRPRVSLAPAQWRAVQDFEDFYRRPAGGSE